MIYVGGQLYTTKNTWYFLLTPTDIKLILINKFQRSLSVIQTLQWNQLNQLVSWE